MLNPMNQSSQPDSLPTCLFSQSDVRAMDSEAQSLPGVSAHLLMEKAGHACFSVINRLWPDARTLSVLCGSGNNGGDGYVIARKAVEAGWDVRVFPVGDPSHQDSAAHICRTAYLAAGGAILDYIPEGFENAEILVDALVGTGLNRAISDSYAAIIAATRRYRGRIFAVDIPSGLCGDSGNVLGDAIRADATMTFMAMKPGLLTGKGPEHAGILLFDDLGLPDTVRDRHQPVAERLTETALRWPARPRHAHKGMCGHVLAIGGDHGYAGAIRLTAEAALRTGAGLVSVASRAQHALWIGSHRPELMCHSAEDPSTLDDLLHKASVIAIGPGLGQSPWAQNLLRIAMDSGKPMVMDADALNLLASQQTAPRSDWLLTPHPGEAARLLGLASAADIERDRLAAVRALQQRYGGIAILKGTGTLIKGQHATPVLASVGNPGMASGGMGDVLTGIIAALLAQGMPAMESALHAVWLHGRAADQAAAQGGMVGMLASDVIANLRECRPENS